MKPDVMVVQPPDRAVELSLDAVQAVRMVRQDGAVLFEGGGVFCEDLGVLVKPFVDIFKAPRDHLSELIEGDAPRHGGVIVSATSTVVKDERLRA